MDLEFGPEAIRELRGSATRAAFAARVGVSELTIYRWEQPPGSPQARRPRKAAREQLARVARQDVSPAGSTQTEARAFEARPLHRAYRHILSARFDAAENALIDALYSGALEHPDGRAFAHVCTGLLALLARNDARAAMSSASAFLAELAAAEVEPAIRARGSALCALVFGTPDGLLFDPARVADHAGRARSDAPPDETDAQALAAIAEAWAAFHQGHRSAFQSHLERRRSDLSAASTPVPRHLRDHLLALSSALDGFQPDACRGLLAIADEAQALGFGLGECRALARLCMASLIAGVTRADVLEITGRYERARTRGSLQPGFSDLLAGAARAEALHGLGRFDETAAEVASVEALAERLDWPAADLLLVRTRLAFHVDGLDGVRALAASFEARWSGLGRTSIDACVHYVRALSAQMDGDALASGALFREAHELAIATGVRPWLELLSALLGLASYAYHGVHEHTPEALRRVDQALERIPSPWFSALRSHLVGVVRSGEGRALEARQLLEASIATHALCGEITEAARGRRALAIVAMALDAHDAESLFEQSEQEFARLGIAATDLQTRQGARRLAELRRDRGSATEHDAVSGLVVGLQRVSVRGLAPHALLRELCGVIAAHLGRTPTLVEVGLARGAPQATEAEVFEFGDGCGRRYRLCFGEPLAPQARAAAQVLISSAALALEVNALRALSNPKSRPAPISPTDLPGFVVTSEPMRALIADVQRMAGSQATVLIHGESGTGKEVVARAVHDASKRASGPYVTLNCTAVPRELFESQLFGHRKGAFTGADRDSLGVARAADGGTLFLDEIGDLPLEVQAKLLRFLENREVQPVGATQPVRVDVRVVAATHRDLPAMVAQGSFRHDLLFRLQVVALRVPPLRARRDDVLPLAEHFLARFGGDAPPRLSPDAVLALMTHAWPGNVRELRNVIERASAFHAALPILGAEHLRLGEQ